MVTGLSSFITELRMSRAGISGCGALSGALTYLERIELFSFNLFSLSCLLFSHSSLVYKGALDCLLACCLLQLPAPPLLESRRFTIGSCFLFIACCGGYLLRETCLQSDALDGSTEVANGQPFHRVEQDA